MTKKKIDDNIIIVREKEIAELKVLVSKLLEIETKKLESMYPNVKIMLGGKQIN